MGGIYSRNRSHRASVAARPKACRYDARNVALLPDGTCYPPNGGHWRMIIGTSAPDPKRTWTPLDRPGAHSAISERTGLKSSGWQLGQPHNDRQGFLLKLHCEVCLNGNRFQSCRFVGASNSVYRHVGQPVPLNEVTSWLHD